MDCAHVISLIIQGFVALGTLGAFYVGFRQIKTEREVREKAEVRSQAVNVAAWFEDITLSREEPKDPYHCHQIALVRNNNLIPIYDVVITVVGQYGAGPKRNGEENEGDYDCRAVALEIPTGLWALWMPTYGGGMHLSYTLEIAFRDAQGHSWIRRGNGQLERIKQNQNPFSYYSISLPVESTSIERVSI